MPLPWRVEVGGVPHTHERANLGEFEDQFLDNHSKRLHHVEHE
jgi:hypothetical protein